MATDRAKCGNCGKSRPYDDTTLVAGKRTGDYRRSTANVRRRVCRTCTQEHVDYVRSTVARGRGIDHVDASYFRWTQAARVFGIDITDLPWNDWDRRVHWPFRVAAAAEYARWDALASHPDPAMED